MQDYKLYKNVMIEVIEKIENSFKSVDKEEFMQDSELQDATLMRLQVIGENIKKIPFEIKKKNKHIKWKKFEKLRNIISHKYDLVDYNLIWSFIENNLDELKLGILKIE
jgi:uncharacterized protein with HEPN domain